MSSRAGIQEVLGGDAKTTGKERHQTLSWRTALATEFFGCNQTNQTNQSFSDGRGEYLSNVDIFNEQVGLHLEHSQGGLEC